ncbi:MAG: tetratricopeptide repeat protein [Candidatus Diapherotrites archaeon]|nr:tetratricopeptide repeat protein [Candidatus Diapherotrites archaeon]
MPKKKPPKGLTKKELVKRTFAPASVNKLLNEFIKATPDLFKTRPPKKLEQPGDWIKRNKKLSKKKLAIKLSEWVHERNEELRFDAFFEKLSKFGSKLDEPTVKTIPRFRLGEVADCVALPAVLAQMLKKSGVKTKYFRVKGENKDLIQLTKQKKERVEASDVGHCYITAEGIQLDPALGLTKTKHKGEEQSETEFASLMWTSHGVNLREKRAYEPALRAHESALKINPNNAEAHTNKAFVHYYLGQYEEAFHRHKKALHHYEKALHHYEKALEIDPNNTLIDYGRALAHHNLGYMKKQQKSSEKPRNLIQKLGSALRRYWLK